MSNQTDSTHIGSRLEKADGSIVTVKKVGFAGKEVVYGLSDGTMVFPNDLDSGKSGIKLAPQKEEVK